MHLHNAFSIWRCSKALSMISLPSADRKHIYRRIWQPLQSGPCMLVRTQFTDLGIEGWKAERTLAGKEVTQIFNPRPGRGSNRGPQDWEAEIKPLRQPLRYRQTRIVCRLKIYKKRLRRLLCNARINLFQCGKTSRSRHLYWARLTLSNKCIKFQNVHNQGTNCEWYMANDIQCWWNCCLLTVGKTVHNQGINEILQHGYVHHLHRLSHAHVEANIGSVFGDTGKFHHIKKISWFCIGHFDTYNYTSWLVAVVPWCLFFHCFWTEGWLHECVNYEKIKKVLLQMNIAYNSRSWEGITFIQIWDVF